MRSEKTLLTVMIMILALMPTFVTAQQQQVTKTTSHTRIVLLGTGNPYADPDRSGPATAIVVNGTPYLVDFGAGVVRRAKAAVVDRGITALEPVNFRVVFVTHLHSDHTVGYADLIFTPSAQRRVPLDQICSDYRCPQRFHLLRPRPATNLSYYRAGQSPTVYISGEGILDVFDISGPLRRCEASWNQERLPTMETYWEIAPVEDLDVSRVAPFGPIIYGRVPAGFRQVTPASGEPPPICEGGPYG